MQKVFVLGEFVALSCSAPSDDERKKSHVAALFERSHFLLCDENLGPGTKNLTANITSDNHCVLFTSGIYEGHELAGFEVMHLDSCLRSTGQLAQFANDCVKILELGCYSTFPCRSFEGESLDIKLNGEKGDKLSFIDLCVRTIVEYAQKMYDVDFLPVANLLEAENTRLIEEGLRKMNYICSFDVMPTAFEDRKSTDTRSVKTPVILFIDPRIYEGCEFPVVLILIDQSVGECASSKVNLRDFGFLIAVTRASLNIVIIVDDSSLPNDKDLKRSLKKNQSEFMRVKLAISEVQKRAKPIVLFVGESPDVGFFVRELNPPQTYVPDVLGISCYVGLFSRIIHLDDVYLESDLNKLKDFGIRYVFFCSKSVKCEWHDLYHTASFVCLENFRKKNPEAFYLIESCSFLLDEQKFVTQRLIAFLKQQSGEPDTKIPCCYVNLQPQTLPKIDTDWSKWKSKAEELYRIRKTTMALKLYHRSFLLLEKKHENDSQQGNLHSAFKSKLELAKLGTNISKIHLEQADGVYHGNIHPLIDFWGFICIAFHFTMQAIQYDPCWSRSYERMHAIVMKLKCRFYSCSMDSCDSRFNYRAKFSDILNENISLLRQKVNYLSMLDELYNSIELHQKKSNEKRDSQLRLQSSISSKAATLSQKNLELIQRHDVESGSVYDAKKCKLLVTHTMLIFEVSVRLAMISSKYSIATKSPEEVLHPALNKLEEVVSRIKELRLFVRHLEMKVIEKSPTSESTQK